MSGMPWDLFSPEQIEVTSGADPGVTIDMFCPSWMLRNVANLSIPTMVFDNRPAPGETGRTALEGIEDQLEATVLFDVTGTVDWNGNPYEDTQVGFRRNWVYLCQHLFRPAGPLEATYYSIDPDEEPIDFLVQFVVPSPPDRHPTDWNGELRLILPNGCLIPEWTGS